jgi:hypothetical protein
LRLDAPLRPAPAAKASLGFSPGWGFCIDVVCARTWVLSANIAGLDLLGNKVPILNAKNGIGSLHVCDFTKSIRRLTIFLASVNTPEAQN